MAQPKMGWDYGLANKGTAAGQQIAAARSRASAQNTASIGRDIRQSKEAEEQNKKAVEAQDLATRTLYSKSYDTFYKPVEDANYNAVQTMWDTSTNRLVDAFHGVQTNKDLSPREQAYQSSTLMRQIEPMARGRKVMDQRIAAYVEAAASGSVSGVMPAKFQNMYADLDANRFKGGIELDGDKLRFKGVTSSGDEINMLVQDFDAHMPNMADYNQAASLSSNLAGIGKNWKKMAETYKQTGKEIDKPIFDSKQVKSAIQETISGYGENGPAKFAVDTLGYTPEEYQNMVDEKMKNKQTVYKGGISELQYSKMSPEMQAQYPPEEVMVSQIDAEIMVLDNLKDQYAEAAEWSFDQSGYGNIQAGKKKLTVKELRDRDFDNNVNQFMMNLNSAVEDENPKVLLENIMGAEDTIGGFNDFEITKVNGDTTMRFKEVTGIKDIKDNSGNVVRQDPTYGPTQSINLSKMSDVEMLYKENLKKGRGDAASKNRIDTLWEQNKDQIMKDLEGISEVKKMNKVKEYFAPLVNQIDSMIEDPKKLP